VSSRHETRLQRDRAALGRVDIEHGQAFFDGMARETEGYELGVACSDRGEVLVSYNPRVRSADIRPRVLRTLESLGFDVTLVRGVFERLEPTQCSTVVGLESGSRATVYVEELTRFLGREGALELAAACHGPFDASSHGQPYILALDLPEGRWKLYWLHTQPPGLVDHPLEAEGAPAWIEQRHLSTGSLKLYRCWDYRSGQDGEQEAATLFGPLPSLPWDTCRVTSLGRRFGEGGYQTVYMAVE
jgi:hypothetical protein